MHGVISHAHAVIKLITDRVVHTRGWHPCCLRYAWSPVTHVAMESMYDIAHLVFIQKHAGHKSDSAVTERIVAACLRAAACDPVPAAVVGEDHRGIAARSGAVARLQGNGRHVLCQGGHAHVGQAGDGGPPGAVDPAGAPARIVEQDKAEALKGRTAFRLRIWEKSEHPSCKKQNVFLLFREVACLAVDPDTFKTTAPIERKSAPAAPRLRQQQKQAKQS